MTVRKAVFTWRERVRVFGTLDIETSEGQRVHLHNALVGPHILAKLAGADTIAADPISHMTVDDLSNVEILALTALDSRTHTDPDEFTVFTWVLGPGVGTGEWDDIYVGTSAGDFVSEFIGHNADIIAQGIANGEKLAGSTWLVRYTLYFQQGVASS